MFYSIIRKRYEQEGEEFIAESFGVYLGAQVSMICCIQKIFQKLNETGCSAFEAESDNGKPIIVLPFRSRYCKYLRRLEAQLELQTKHTDIKRRIPVEVNLMPTISSNLSQMASNHKIFKEADRVDYKRHQGFLIEEVPIKTIKMMAVVARALGELSYVDNFENCFYNEDGPSEQWLGGSLAKMN